MAIPLWRELLMTVRPEVKWDLQWPMPPFLRPSKGYQVWAEQFVRNIAPEKPIFVVWPLGGLAKGIFKAREEEKLWRRKLAEQFTGQIIVPTEAVADAEEVNRWR